MSFQSQAFLNGLGDDWFKRNKADLGKRDPASDLLAAVNMQPKSVLEVGCSNGWRLKKLKEKYGCNIIGIDPSAEAIKDANDPEHFAIATADKIPTPDNSFDLVILGYCMFFIPPEDWMKVVSETTRVLADGGFLLIYDGLAARPLRIEYMKGDDGSITHFYFYDWQKLWLSHPGYEKVTESTETYKSITEHAVLLHKDIGGIFSHLRQGNPPK